MFSKVIEAPLFFFFCASFTLLSLKSIPQAQLPPDPVQSPRALCARGEVICLFTAGLIKTVMCRELFGPQSMHFDLESQIESHLTLVGPRLAAQAGDRCCCPSTMAPLDLNKFLPQILSPCLSRLPPVGSSSKTKAFLVRARKAEHLEHSWGPLAEETGAGFLWIPLPGYQSTP